MRRSDRLVTDDSEIRDIISRCKVCRLGLCDRGEAYIVPLNFGFDYDSDGALRLYFHCAHEGRKLDLIRDSPRVSFEMDGRHALSPAENGKPFCLYGFLYESIIGRGEITFLSGPEKRRGLSLLMKHQAGLDCDFTDREASAVEVLCLTVSSLSCKQRSL